MEIQRDGTIRFLVPVSRDTDVTFDIPGEVVRRLRITCFRGRNQRLAGNFLAWNTAEDLATEDLIFEEVFRLKNSRIGDRENPTAYVTVEAGYAVGWSSTDSLEAYRPEDLEWFQPNKHCRAQRIKAELAAPRGVCAPLTTQITFVVSRQNWWHLVIRSIYPGSSIGPLRGPREANGVLHDLSARENIIFFGWDFPGEEPTPTRRRRLPPGI